MEQLDNNKIPRIGSQGEKYRDLQLIIQLPKQVLFKLGTVCHFLIVKKIASIHYKNSKAFLFALFFEFFFLHTPPP